MFIHKSFLSRAIYLSITFIIVGFFTSCSITDPGSNEHDQNYTARESFSYQFSSQEITLFELDAVNGNIEIIGQSDSDSIKIWGERIVRSDSREDAENALTYLIVDVETYNNSIGVETKQPNQSNGRSYEVEYHVRLPQSIRVNVQSVNSELEVQDILSDIILSVINGTIGIMGVQGSCDASLVNGQIDCQMTLIDQDACHLSTVNGNINLTLPDSTSASYTADVVNGIISVSGFNVQNMQTSKTSASGILGSGSGSIRLNTVNGNVNLKGE